MATSESDDFESADEELSHGMSSKRAVQTQQWSSPGTIDSESDEDTEYVPRTPCNKSAFNKKSEKFRPSVAGATTGEKTPANDMRNSNFHSGVTFKHNAGRKQGCDTKEDKSKDEDTAFSGEQKEESFVTDTQTAGPSDDSNTEVEKPAIDESHEKCDAKTDTKQIVAAKSELNEKERTRRQRRSESSRHSGAKKLGTRIAKDDFGKTVVLDAPSATAVIKTPMECLDKTDSEKRIDNSEDRLSQKSVDKNQDNSGSTSKMDELSEMDMPEELKSNKKFKEIFKPEGWEGLGNDIELPEELTEDKLQPVLERLSLAGQGSENASSGWGNWGSWGVNSLINTATAGVSTLTSHVTHGLTLLEGAVGVPDSLDSGVTNQQNSSTDDETLEVPQEPQSHGSFGIGNFISGVSSITKLVEATGTKVMTGGLDTLEAIGKKTMEVLQEGDPGLKKKRAFFTNDADRPILSQILREAKEKAETEEKTIEEKQRARRVHFESLFDDYQGLVHLEALEMLSKQSNMKIQQHLIGLDTHELTSVQETLEEVKELCNLGEEDEEEETEKTLKNKLEVACNDLGIDITYEKLYDICEKTDSYLTSTHTNHEIFECAISTLAQFTAFSVERFHKTAELLLIKERRSTVNEADALVQLTNIFSIQIGTLADSFCETLNKCIETSDKANDINANMTTIFSEAANASSYVQDAFRLLIPILQVGAI